MSKIPNSSVTNQPTLQMWDTIMATFSKVTYNYAGVLWRGWFFNLFISFSSFNWYFSFPSNHCSRIDHHWQFGTHLGLFCYDIEKCLSYLFSKWAFNQKIFGCYRMIIHLSHVWWHYLNVIEPLVISIDATKMCYSLFKHTSRSDFHKWTSSDEPGLQRCGFLLRQ